MADYLFVYGSLKKGFKNYQAYMASYGLPEPEKAYIHGSLYALEGKYYPAVLLNTQTERVYGEIYPLDVISATHMAELNALEDFDEQNVEAGEYRRVETLATLADGRQVSCYVYVYPRAVAGMQKITTGSWQE